MKKSCGSVSEAIDLFMDDIPSKRALGAVRLYLHCREGAVQEVESRPELVEKAVAFIQGGDREQIRDGAFLLYGLAKHGAALKGLDDDRQFFLRLAALSVELPRHVVVEKLMAKLAEQNPERRHDTLIPFFLKEQSWLRLPKAAL